MISRRFPSLSATTNSNPEIVGSIVMNEIVPSSFFREATALFHSPTSKSVAVPSLSTFNLAERRVRVARGQLRDGGRVGRDDETLPLLRDRGFPLRRGDLQHLLGLRLPVEEHLEKPAEERTADDDARVGVREYHGADP